MHCSDCGADQAAVERLIAADALYAVCAGCVALLTEVEAAFSDEPRAASPLACTFCGGAGQPLIVPTEAYTEPPAAICSGCLAQCRAALGG